MESGGVDGGVSSSTPLKWKLAISKKYEQFLDKSTTYFISRWLLCLDIVTIYTVRVYLLQGFYLVSYAIGFCFLYLLIEFMLPQVDPHPPTLPVRASDEFRPFLRALPEFKFWYSITKAFCIGFVMTFFSIFDVPVFWPILFIYWILLFTDLMRKQILHMIKCKYAPFSFGKQCYDRKREPSTDSESLLPRD